MREMDAERDEYEEKSKAYSKILNQIDGLNEDIKERKQELDKKQVEVETRRECLEKNLTMDNNRNELQDMIVYSDSKIDKERQKLKAMEGEQKDLESQLGEKQRKTKELNATKGKLSAEKIQHDKNLRERWVSMDNVSKSTLFTPTFVFFTSNSEVRLTFPSFSWHPNMVWN